MKANRRYKLIIGILCAFVGTGVSQTIIASTGDSIVANDSNAVFYFYQSDFDNNLSVLRRLNTSLHRFQIYKPSSIQPSREQTPFGINTDNLFDVPRFNRVNLGNIASPSTNLLHLPDNQIGFRLGLSGLSNLIFEPDGVIYYNLKSPFTELHYIAGSKKEQVLRVVHSQNIFDGFNAGIEYRRINSEGFYLHQKTNSSNFRAHALYNSKNGRYAFLANSIWNSLSSKENGGIEDDSFFEDSTKFTSSIIEINLDSAETTWKGHNLFLKQHLNFGKKKNVSPNDSIDSWVFVPSNRISYSINYREYRHNYHDEFPDTPFYRSIFLDSTITNESIKLIRVENALGWSTYRNLDEQVDSSAKLNAGIDLIHEYIEYDQHTIDSFISNLMVKVRLGSVRGGRLLWRLTGKYVLNGENEEDYSSSLYVSGKMMSNIELRFCAGMQQRSPTIYSNVLTTNHFNWNNNFSKTSLARGKLEFISHQLKLRIGVTGAYYDNYIYYDSLVTPTQSKDPFVVYSAYLRNDLSFWKINFNNRIIYQHSKGIKEIRIPALVTYHSLYYGDWIFKKALFFQIGADVFFNTAYYAYGYMPAAGQFYVQNENKIGDYAFIDLFANLQIKKARVFFKVSHLNSGLMGNNYYSTPHYPAPARSYKFGVSWMFYD